jgi:hypothetical protein
VRAIARAIAVAIALGACAKDKPAPTPAPAPATAAPADAAPAAPASAPDAALHAAGSWEPVGTPGGWNGTRLAVTLGDHMYSIEKGDGRLWDTLLATGEWHALGRPEFGASTNLFAVGDRLYTFETDGTMYRIDPATGTWEVVGKAGTWKATRLAVALGGHIFTIENGDARIFKTDVATGETRVIGKADFGRTMRRVATTTALYTLEDDGSLYRVDPTSGAWVRVGTTGAWKGTRLAAVIGETMYSIERSDGRMWKTALATGEHTVIGAPDFARTHRLLATATLLYTIEDDGTLYRVWP